MQIHREKTVTVNPLSTRPPSHPSTRCYFYVALTSSCAPPLDSCDYSWGMTDGFCIMTIVWSTEYRTYIGGDETGWVYLPIRLEHTLQLCMVTIVKGGGRAPSSPHQPWANFSIMVESLECTPESGGCHLPLCVLYSVVWSARQKRPVATVLVQI